MKKSITSIVMIGGKGSKLNDLNDIIPSSVRLLGFGVILNSTVNARMTPALQSVGVDPFVGYDMARLSP